MMKYFDIHVTREDKSFSVGVAMDGSEYPSDERIHAEFFNPVWQRAENVAAIEAHESYPEVLVVAVDQRILDADDVECVDSITEITKEEYQRLLNA